MIPAVAIEKASESLTADKFVRSGGAPQTTWSPPWSCAAAGAEAAGDWGRIRAVGTLRIAFDLQLC